MSSDDLASFLDRYTIEYVRTFPHPIERVWQAIVDPAEIGQWFEPPTEWDIREGGSYRFHDDNLAGPILAFKPPRLIRFQDNVGWAPIGAEHPGPAADDIHWFQFELEPVSGGTRLRFTHHVPAGQAREGQAEHAWDTPWWPGLLEGWHLSLDGMADVVDGVPIGSRLPQTPASAIAQSWVEAARDSRVPLTAQQRAAVVLELRVRERGLQLERQYRAHVDAMLPHGPPRPAG